MSEFYCDSSYGSGIDENIFIAWVDNGTFGDNNSESENLKAEYPEFVNKQVEYGQYVY